MFLHRLLVFASAAFATVFILVLGLQLPERVAAHFNVAGQADGFMPRSAFVALMVLLAGALPVLGWWLPVRQARQGTARIPHAAHWLTPEQRESTLRWISGHATVFSVATSAFLSLVFWLTWQANQAHSALALTPFLAGLGAYLLLTLLWVLALRRRFGRSSAAAAP